MISHLFKIALSPLLFWSLLTSQSVAADKLSIVLDWFVNPDHGPLIIAQEKGYFADENLEVEIIAPADPSTPPKIVAANQADLAISYQSAHHLNVHNGLPIVRVGTLIASPLNCLLVLKDGPIQSIADLKDKKIGYSISSGIEEATLGAMLNKYGLTISDVELINVNWSLAPSLMSKQVDAILGAYRNFELNQMDIEGHQGKCFFLEEEGVPAYDELIYVANNASMDSDKIRRFLSATEKATQFIVNYPEVSWQTFSATSKELQDELNERAWKDTLTRFALRPAALDSGRYKRYESFLLDSGLIDETLPVSKLAIDVGAL